MKKIISILSLICAAAAPSFAQTNAQAVLNLFLSHHAKDVLNWQRDIRLEQGSVQTLTRTVEAPRQVGVSPVSGAYSYRPVTWAELPTNEREAILQDNKLKAWVAWYSNNRDISFPQRVNSETLTQVNDTRYYNETVPMPQYMGQPEPQRIQQEVPVYTQYNEPEVRRPAVPAQQQVVYQSAPTAGYQEVPTVQSPLAQTLAVPEQAPFPDPTPQKSGGQVYSVENVVQAMDNTVLGRVQAPTRASAQPQSNMYPEAPQAPQQQVEYRQAQYPVQNDYMYATAPQEQVQAVVPQGYPIPDYEMPQHYTPAEAAAMQSYQPQYQEAPVQQQVRQQQQIRPEASDYPTRQYPDRALKPIPAQVKSYNPAQPVKRVDDAELRKLADLRRQMDEIEQALQGGQRQVSAPEYGQAPKAPYEAEEYYLEGESPEYLEPFYQPGEVIQQSEIQNNAPVRLPLKQAQISSDLGKYKIRLNEEDMMDPNPTNFRLRTME